MGKILHAGTNAVKFGVIHKVSDQKTAYIQHQRSGRLGRFNIIYSNSSLDLKCVKWQNHDASAHLYVVKTPT